MANTILDLAYTVLSTASDGTTTLNGEQVAVSEFKGVKFTAADVDLKDPTVDNVAAVTDVIVGVAQHDVLERHAAQGAQVTVRIEGVTKMRAGAAFNAGVKLQPASDGRAVTQTSTNPVLGIAMQRADAENELVDVLLTPANVV